MPFLAGSLVDTELAQRLAGDVYFGLQEYSA